MTSTSSGAARPVKSTDDLTISEAEDVTGFERTTIKRDLRDGRYPNAYQDDRDVWHIPVSDLRDAKRLPAGSVDTVREQIAAFREARETRQLREELIRTQEQLAATRAQNEELKADKAQLQATINTLIKKVA